MQVATEYIDSVAETLNLSGEEMIRVTHFVAAAHVLVAVKSIAKSLARKSVH